MKSALIVLLIVGLLSCDRPRETKTVELGEMESVTKDEKLKLIEQLQTHFEYLASYEGWKEEALDDFFFVDLDNDRDLDVVFTGWSGGEPVCVRLFNNRGGEYKEVFEAYQKITSIELKDNKLSRISIHDPGCCAAYIEFDEDYSFDVNADDFKFILTNRTALLHPTEEPKEKFSKPINFEVLNDKYFLRLTPKIDTVDQAFAEDMQHDNVIAEFKKGTKGIAYAEATDETGRVWWFVEIDPFHKPTKSLFYDIDEKPTKVKGWMSSNYLKKL
jgi:hypothetical protein